MIMIILRCFITLKKIPKYFWTHFSLFGTQKTMTFFSSPQKSDNTTEKKAMHIYIYIYICIYIYILYFYIQTCFSPHKLYNNNIPFLPPINSFITTNPFRQPADLTREFWGEINQTRLIPAVRRWWIDPGGVAKLLSCKWNASEPQRLFGGRGFCLPFFYEP